MWKLAVKETRRETLDNSSPKEQERRQIRERLRTTQEGEDEQPEYSQSS
jgi:hypothetical protein